MSFNNGESDGEWEEVVLVAEVNGVLDASLVRQAVKDGNINLRNPGTSNPILQISNSLYTGKWSKNIGTDVILECENNQMKVISVTDRFLKTEKALLTAKEGAQIEQSNVKRLEIPKDEQKL